MRLRRAFPNAHLFSFEPDPRNIHAMRQNGAARLTTLVEAAVADQDGPREFHLSSAELAGAPSWVKTTEYSGSSSLKRPAHHTFAHPWCKFESSITVRGLTLDTFVSAHEIDRIDFMWADVQGAEDLLIAGGQQALSRTEFLYTECVENSEYQGQIGLDEILRRLPGAWELVERFPYDALLRNRTLLDAPR